MPCDENNQFSFQLFVSTCLEFCTLMYIAGFPFNIFYF